MRASLFILTYSPKYSVARNYRLCKPFGRFGTHAHTPHGWLYNLDRSEVVRLVEITSSETELSISQSGDSRFLHSMTIFSCSKSEYLPFQNGLFLTPERYFSRCRTVFFLLQNGISPVAERSFSYSGTVFLLSKNDLSFTPARSFSYFRTIFLLLQYILSLTL